MEAKFLESEIVPDVIDTPPQRTAEVHNLIMLRDIVQFYNIGAMEYA